MSTSMHWRPVVSAAALSLVLAGQSLGQAPLIINDLSSPRGLSVSGDTLLIADQANGRILRVARNGTVEIVLEGVPASPAVPGGLGTPGGAALPPGGPGGPPPGAGGPPAGGPPGAGALPPGAAPPPGDPLGIPAVVEVDGTIFYLTNGTECKCAWSLAPGGERKMVADLGAFETANNTDGDSFANGDPELDANPFDLVGDGAGGLYVSDSGANTVLHVSAVGEITPFAIFPNRDNPDPETFGPVMDQVPTGLVVGPDGAVYVGTLTGLPFPPGGALVYRLDDGNGDGDALDDGEMTIAAEGLNATSDVAFDTDGTLLVTEISTDLSNGTPGRLVRVGNGTIEEIAVELMQPTGVAVLSDGTIMVAQEAAGVVAAVGTAP